MKKIFDILFVMLQWLNKVHLWFFKRRTLETNYDSFIRQIFIWTCYRVSFACIPCTSTVNSFESLQSDPATCSFRSTWTKQCCTVSRTRINPLVLVTTLRRYVNSACRNKMKLKHVNLYYCLKMRRSMKLEKRNVNR